uniref:PH domain-containing protein n=1 Tax=Globisporangium ultimum (strain ATCC 200006 / CBS 805.95 / DAOM BR144) TaxID=431595 RepID=K3WLK4_GLOUD
MVAPSASDSSRPTDLSAVDIAQVLANNLLAFDKRESEFSGWIHVAELPSVALGAQDTALASMTHTEELQRGMSKKQRKRVRKERKRLVFHRRFCRLRELMCTFYADDAPTCEPLDRLVIISVARVHDRNKAFQVVDYEDRRLEMYTTLGADFEEWYGAFASAVRTTQVAKSSSSRVPDEMQHESQHRARRQRRRSGRKATTVAPTEEDGEDEQEEEDDRTRTAWLYLESPWWRLHQPRRRYYFVLSRATLGCFSVNKEGQLAEKVVTVAKFTCDLEHKSLIALHVTCATGKTMRLTCSSNATTKRTMRDWVDHLQDALEAPAS